MSIAPERRAELRHNYGGTAETTTVIELLDALDENDAEIKQLRRSLDEIARDLNAVLCCTSHSDTVRTMLTNLRRSVLYDARALTMPLSKETS